MKAYISIFLTIFLFFGNGAQLISEEQSGKKDPKILVLIISSNNMQAYIDLQDIWKQYMNLDPEHFEAYFIVGNPDLKEDYEIKGNYLSVKTEESYVPGIINKTLLSMEAMVPRFKEFDYVLRTNLSSFYDFPRLLKFVKTLPRKKCYCGIQMYITDPKFGVVNFVSGAGILLSTDLAKMAVDEKNKIFKFNKDLPDDVLLGLYFQSRFIPSLAAGRTDFATFDEWLAKKDQIPKSAFHFRAKNNYNQRSAAENFADEIAIDKELLKMFYPQTTLPLNSKKINES